MNIKEWLQLINYRITEGSDYCWNCFGQDAYSLDSWNGDHDGHSSSITFDRKTQTVYSFEICDYKNSRAYRYLNPDYKDSYFKELKDRDCDDSAWDDVKWTNLELFEDWKEKATAIINGLDYDTRVLVPLNLTDEELLVIFKMAHEKDITFNKMVENILENFISNFDKKE